MIPPLGESLPNTEIFRRLAARFGFDEPCFTATDAELMDDAVDPDDPRLAASDRAGSRPPAALQMTGPDGKPLVLFENVFPATPSGKIELKSETLAQRWGAAALLPGWRERQALASADADFAGVRQAHLIDARRSRRLAPRAAAADAPEDAVQRSLEQGGEVRVWNDRGEVILPLDVTDEVPPGVVASEKGAWLETSRTGQTISALVSADLRADLAEGACFNDTPVEVSRA